MKKSIFFLFRTQYGLFAVTIFLSSFLLFQIQPLIGKHILPWLGGGSAVWITAMFFFIVVLALGYFYALFITRLPFGLQAIVHVGITGLIGSYLIYHGGSWPSPITPSSTDVPIAALSPFATVLRILGVSVGLPTFLLSSTSTLLQFWYGKLSGKEPFSLYALSNMGSLAGLLSYPVLVEPFFSTYEQGHGWSLAFGVYTTLLIAILYHALQHPTQIVTQPRLQQERIRPHLFFCWVGLAGVPVMMMLSVTSYLTSSIVVIPLLWILPLGLYLLSFVISFRKHTIERYWFLWGFTLFSVVLALLITTLAGFLPITVKVSVIFLALFSVFHVCHETLYRLRPSIEGLSLFYVALSLGGVVGSIVITGVSFYWLVHPIEFTILLTLVGLMMLYQLFKKGFFERKLFQGWRQPGLAILLTCSVLGAMTLSITQNITAGIYQTRNFFGYKLVKEDVYDGELVRLLKHGTTVHGGQIVETGQEKIPATYYGENSGVGRAFAALRSQFHDKNIRVAVIGVGSGAVAAYCRPGDQFALFEVDAQVVDIASRYFSYLKQCPGATVTLADGRLGLATLAKTTPNLAFDVIIIDAYADDMVPIHLLTKEAVQEYRRMLTKDGLLMLHLSSRYLNLRPVVAAYESADFSGRWYLNSETNAPNLPSLWAAFSHNTVWFKQPMFQPFSVFHEQLVQWTDTYSALLPIITY